MKTRVILVVAMVVVILAAMVPIGGVLAGVRSSPQAATPLQEGPPIPDQRALLNYPYPVSIENVTDEGDRLIILDRLTARCEFLELASAMESKGFLFDPAAPAQVMRITIEGESGLPTVLEGFTMSTTHTVDALSGALTIIEDMSDPERLAFAQAHHTNLDPHLAEVPDPPITFNDMPYFYITTLRWVGPCIGGQIIYWHYWWFDSHHHPNWYYSHYFWYWQHWSWYWYPVDWPWPYWYHWVYGWYYWKYWYFWSTWFPWADYPTVLP